MLKMAFAFVSAATRSLSFCWRSSYNKTTSYVQISVCIISYQDWALVCFIMDIICTQYASHTSLALRYCFYLDISAKIIAKIFP